MQGLTIEQEIAEVSPQVAPKSRVYLGALEWVASTSENSFLQIKWLGGRRFHPRSLFELGPIAEGQLCLRCANFSFSLLKQERG